MVRHFGDCGPVILEKVRSSDPFIRKARERFVRHDLFVSLLVIELVLLIAGQSLQPLPRLDEYGIL